MASLRQQIDGLMASSKRLARVASGPASPPEPIRSIATPYGELYRAVSRWPTTHRHGVAEIGSALEVRPAALSKLALDPVFDSVALENLLLIDTETTGLSKGAGTLAFLIGVGHFEGAGGQSGLRLEQLFLRRPGEEAAMLEHLAEWLERSSLIVSYNGKSFDWPLLRTRFVLNRIAVPKVPPHLDLLHCCRRLYRSTVGSMRLVALERELLQMHREDDLDGSLAPEIYLSYLKGRDDGLLGGVLRHNELDLIALAALLGMIGKDYDELRPDAGPREQLAFARVALRGGDVEHADRFLQAVVEGDEDESACEAWALRAQRARKARDLWTEEESLHRALAHADDLRAPGLHLTLAKLYEHRRHDLERALAHAELAEREEGRDPNAHRRARLERKISGRSKR